MKEQLVQKLIKNRPELVDQIEPAELLNRLLASGVLTKRQTTSISCQPDPYRQNEAILDALHRRPDEDFEKFCQALIDTNQEKIVIDYLKQSATDSQEFSSLVDWSLASGPAAIERIDVKQSSEGFYAEKKDQSYPMCNSCRGRCIVISNEVFTCSKTLADREGSSADVDNLKNLFSQLHFSVTVLENQTAQDMLEHILEVSRDESLGNDQCFILFVLSHGKQIPIRSSTGEVFGTEYIFGSDGELVSTNSLLAPFTDDNCPSLRGKPKLFFFQACRGGVIDRTEADCVPGDDVVQHVTLSDASATENVDRLSTEATDAFPTDYMGGHINLKDFLIGYPSQSGYRSFRNRAVGSWYINALVRVFETHAWDSDVALMLRTVNSYVTKWVSSPGSPLPSNSTQCAEIKDCLTRGNLFLFPGIVKTL